MPTDSAAVRLTNLRLERGGRAVLDRIDLVVPRGSVTAVLGPSGSGKSTLLAALTGELEPAAGTVEVFGAEDKHHFIMGSPRELDEKLAAQAPGKAPAAWNCREVQRPRSANDGESPAEFCFIGLERGNRSGHRGHDCAGRQERQCMKAVAKQAG